MAASPEFLSEAREIQRMEGIFRAQKEDFARDPMPSAEA